MASSSGITEEQMGSLYFTNDLRALTARPMLPHSHFQLEPVFQTRVSLLTAECGVEKDSGAEELVYDTPHMVSASLHAFLMQTVHLRNVTVGVGDLAQR